MKAVVGLGNPGKRYARTRHNAGFMVVDALAGEAGRSGWAEQCQSLVLRVPLCDQEVLLAKPLTFMNLSGRAVRQLMSRHGMEPRDLLIVYDDVDLPLGRIRVRERGSAGGHHGMESILRALDTDALIRIRLGIDEEGSPEDKAGFVLSDFPRECAGDVRDMIARAAGAVRSILSDGVSKAMSLYNA